MRADVPTRRRRLVRAVACRRSPFIFPPPREPPLLIESCAVILLQQHQSNILEGLFLSTIFIIYFFILFLNADGSKNHLSQRSHTRLSRLPLTQTWGGEGAPAEPTGSGTGFFFG